MADTPQLTLLSVADYLSDARVLLQDSVSPNRYDDSSLLTALNVTLLEARANRADLFLWCKKDVQHFVKVDDTVVEVEPIGRVAILHGVVGHALERDQEDYQDVRASQFLGIFYDMLGVKAPRPVGGGSGPGRP